MAGGPYSAIDFTETFLATFASRDFSPAERRLFLKRRWRGQAEDGTEFGFDLAERLAHGQVIFVQDDVDYVIHQIPEPVLEIPLGDPSRAALLASGRLSRPRSRGRTAA